MNKKNVLVVAAHPDDEILGVGGTLLKHIKNGNKVFCLILGEGITSREGSTEKDLKSLHRQCAEAGKIIGFTNQILLTFPDNKFDTIPLLDIVKEIENHMRKIKPDIVYTHHKNDVNIDHQLTYAAVMTACRPCNPCCPNEIYSFETLSSTEWQVDDYSKFSPHVFIDIEQELLDKIKALGKYSSEMKKYPHPRSKEGVTILASFRGLQSNLKYAEAFRLERKIE